MACLILLFVMGTCFDFGVCMVGWLCLLLFDLRVLRVCCLFVDELFAVLIAGLCGLLCLWFC